MLKYKLKFEDSKSELNKSRIKSDSIEKELSLTKATLQKINRSKQELEQEAEANHVYIRKLESKIATGRGETLASFNT
jgi:predicted  nucleic acid-binding Zn-ribbon protein